MLLNVLIIAIIVLAPNLNELVHSKNTAKDFHIQLDKSRINGLINELPPDFEPVKLPKNPVAWKGNSHYASSDDSLIFTGVDGTVYMQYIDRGELYYIELERVN